MFTPLTSFRRKPDDIKAEMIYYVMFYSETQRKTFPRYHPLVVIGRGKGRAGKGGLRAKKTR